MIEIKIVTWNETNGVSSSRFLDLSKGRLESPYADSVPLATLPAAHGRVNNEEEEEEEEEEENEEEKEKKKKEKKEEAAGELHPTGIHSRVNFLRLRSININDRRRN
uniref:Uncharacterized protein n=1 Tax=Vespula pensylvanica TaxID=30213 RepID=A0A834P789_VESPE|nr:hypothetical protein H0235_004333 [Vespula pensylvanica]